MSMTDTNIVHVLPITCTDDVIDTCILKQDGLDFGTILAASFFSAGTRTGDGVKTL